MGLWAEYWSGGAFAFSWHPSASALLGASSQVEDQGMVWPLRLLTGTTYSNPWKLEWGGGRGSQARSMPYPGLSQRPLAGVSVSSLEKWVLSCRFLFLDCIKTRDCKSGKPILQMERNQCWRLHWMSFFRLGVPTWGEAGLLWIAPSLTVGSPERWPGPWHSSSEPGFHHWSASTAWAFPGSDKWV